MEKYNLNNCTCSIETIEKSERSGRIKKYYDTGCLVHDEIAFRNGMINYLYSIRYRLNIPGSIL